MDLRNIQWKEFYLNEIFTSIQRGKRLKKNNHKKGNKPYVSSTSLNNGVDGFVGNSENIREFKHCLTIANSGSVGSTYFQPFSFVASDHITKLENEIFNKYIYQFISSISKRLSEKYSFNREINDKRIQREKILLPVNSKGEPDYVFMEQFMRQKEQEKIDKFQKYIAKRIEQVKDFKTLKPLNQIEWGEFYLNQIFTEIQRGRRLKKDDHKKGSMPYISSSSINNGVDGYVSNKDKVRIFSKCLSIANSGSVGATFYQPFSFVASDHITKLENKNFNEFIYLFISGITKRLSEKYSFNREINDTRIQREKILLPTDKNGQPDYDYMENYIKKLEYEKLIKYLKLKQ